MDSVDLISTMDFVGYEEIGYEGGLEGDSVVDGWDGVLALVGDLALG